MYWFWSLLGRRDDTQPADHEAFARREAELQARLARLEREVDVIQRVETSEEPRA